MRDETDIYIGGCLCGAVRYEAHGRPHAPQVCHCRMCQRASGAPMLAFASFERNGFRYTRGEPRVYRSSALALRSFCPHCGTSLAFEYAAGDPTVGITLASLDDPSRIRPEVHFGVESKLDWVQLSDHLPHCTTDEDPEWQSARSLLLGIPPHGGED